MDEETTPTEPKEPETPVAPKGPGFLSRHKTAVFIVVSLSVLGFGGNYYITQSTKKDPVSTASIFDTLGSEDDAASGTGPIAKVNGVEISRVDYQNSIKEIGKVTTQQGFNPTDSSVASQIRQQAVAVLINTQLLIQSAEASGIEISDARVNEEYQKILTDMGSEEVLTLTLKDMSLTKDDLLQDIREQLAVDQHIQTETNYLDIKVSDEEVTDYYKNISANNTEVPPLENISEQIKAQLLTQKQQQAVSDFIQGLREGAEIEILI